MPLDTWQVWVFILLSTAGLLAFAALYQRKRRAVIAVLKSEPRGMTAPALADAAQIPSPDLWPILRQLKEEGIVESYDVRSIRLYKLRRLYDV